MAEISRLIGVYHADGTLRGELTYVIGRWRGTAHCALCDITHGRVRRKAEWDRCVSTLPIPFELFHLNDQPADVRALTAGQTPCVLGMTDDGPVMLLGPAELDACAGDPERLVAMLSSSVRGFGR